MTGDRSPVSIRRSSDRWEILRRHVQDGVPLTVLSQQTGVGVRTLERWHAAVKHHGPAGLEAATRSDRGTRRAVPDLVALVEGLALLRPRRSTATIARAAARVAADHGWKPLSYSVVRDIISGLDPSTVTLAQDGPVAYRDKYELLWRHRAERPNAVWQADHTELDILIRAPNGQPARPWLTVVLDDHSRAVCGYLTFLGAPSAMNTALALRQAIWPKPVAGWPMCGIPDRLYVDHGSDFTSHQLAQISHDLHFKIIFSAVARPQGRGKVERLFGSINTELLADLPGHLAPGQRRPEPTLTLRELDDAIGRFITQNYLPRQHPEIGQPPTAAWVADGWLPRLPTSLDELDGLLLTVATPRKVHRDGIHFQGLRYVATTLAAFVGEPVIIRYDPRDITEIRVFNQNRFLCAAIDPDHAGDTISLKDIQAARAAQRRAVRSHINDRIATVAAYLPELTAPPAGRPADQPSRTRRRLRTYYEDDP
jgi:putative transposase